MSANARGFLHGVLYSAAAAGLLAYMLPDGSSATPVLVAFVVLDTVSCITYAAFVVRGPMVGSAGSGS